MGFFGFRISPERALEVNEVFQFLPAGSWTPTVTLGGDFAVRKEVTAGQPNLISVDGDASNNDATRGEAWEIHFVFDEDWDLGTITYQVYWTSTGAVSTGVRFGLQGLARGDGDPYAAAYGTAVETNDDAQGTARDLYIAPESTAVTIAGTPAARDLISLRLYRDVLDAQDDMTQDLELIGVGLYYTAA